MAQLTLSNIHKSHTERHLLRGLSLVLKPGERVGLLGPNGSGKSTLLRIAAGLDMPDEGRRSVTRGLAVGFLEQEPTLPAELTLRQAVLAGLPGRDAVLSRLDKLHAALEVACTAPSEVKRLLAEQARLDDELTRLGGYDVDHKADALLAGLGLPDPERSCAPLSGGEGRRVALARLLLSEPELLLLDEPTNHLDAETIDWLEDHLLASRAALLMVTHDRYVLDRVVHRIVELDQGQLHSYDGGYGDYLVARLARMEGERRVESSRLNMLRRETAWMRRGPPARSTKAQARKARYHDLVSAEPESRAELAPFRIPPGPRLGTKVITLQGVCKSFDGRALLRDFDLELGPGSRLGVIGPNGAGKSTLLQLCTGALAPDVGAVQRGETVKLASIDQRRSELDPEQTVVEAVSGSGGHVRVGEELRRVESFLDQFLFTGDLKYARIRTLSGGERNRVLLARLLCADGNVLLLDEPTNDLDLMTLRALEEALVAFPGAAIVVSHDRFFLDRVATQVLHLDGNGHARLDVCDVSRLLERLAEDRQRDAGRRKRTRAVVDNSPAVETGNAQSASPSATPQPDKNRLNNWEQAEYDALPDRIAEAENDVAVLDERLGSPELVRGDPEAMRSVLADRQNAQDSVNKLFERWEQLESRAADGG